MKTRKELEDDIEAYLIQATAENRRNIAALILNYCAEQLKNYEAE